MRLSLRRGPLSKEFFSNPNLMAVRAPLVGPISRQTTKKNSAASSGHKPALHHCCTQTRLYSCCNLTNLNINKVQRGRSKLSIVPFATSPTGMIKQICGLLACSRKMERLIASDVVKKEAGLKWRINYLATSLPKQHTTNHLSCTAIPTANRTSSRS